MSQIFTAIALSADNFFNQIGCRSYRIRKGNIELLPRPLVAWQGVQGTEGIGGELAGEAVDTWQVVAAIASMQQIFGDTWRDAVQPHISNWELNQDGQGWRRVRVMGQPDAGEGGRVTFKLVSLGFDVFSNTPPGDNPGGSILPPLTSPTRQFTQSTPVLYQEFVHNYGSDPIAVVVYRWADNEVVTDRVQINVTDPNKAIAITTAVPLAYRLTLRF